MSKITIRNEDGEKIQLEGHELDLGGISIAFGQNFILLKDNETLEEMEAAYWDIEEFKADPNLVFGAIFGIITTEAENVEITENGMYFEAKSDNGITFTYPSVMNEAILNGFAITIGDETLMTDVNTLREKENPLTEISAFITDRAAAN